jgi:hypothetical protein
MRRTHLAICTSASESIPCADQESQILRWKFLLGCLIWRTRARRRHRRITTFSPAVSLQSSDICIPICVASASVARPDRANGFLISVCFFRDLLFGSIFAGKVLLLLGHSHQQRGLHRLLLSALLLSFSHTFFALSSSA